jgi:hypothetical protein
LKNPVTNSTIPDFLLDHPRTMAHRSNPNTPSASRRLSARKIKSKRVKGAVAGARRAEGGGIAKVPRTSQALRQSAPLSKKKAKKLERQMGYDAKRKEEAEREKSEVEMKDVAEIGEKNGKKVEKMEVD